jgi:hypothetical protein
MFNIAATPKGGSDYITHHHVSRGRGSLRSPHPLAMVPEPPRGPTTQHAMINNKKEEVMFKNNVSMNDAKEPLRGFQQHNIPRQFMAFVLKTYIVIKA